MTADEAVRELQYLVVIAEMYAKQCSEDGVPSKDLDSVADALNMGIQALCGYGELRKGNIVGCAFAGCEGCPIINNSWEEEIFLDE